MEAHSLPGRYPRRVLLAIAGLTPQVVTETLYALAVESHDPFVPTEVHLITTVKGAESARVTLLGDAPGWFGALCREYDLGPIEFDEHHIHVLRDGRGRALHDIRDPEDNECAADFITDWIRRLTLDPDCALHVSMAGGRKTMGFYAGYALSLYGRSQDRLSHVLISPPELESHPDFFFPSRSPRAISAQGATQRPLDTREARVTLGNLPFVQLRHGLPTRLREGAATFTAAVHAVSQTLGAPHLVLDPECLMLVAGGKPVQLPRAQFIFYFWLTKRLAEDRPLIGCPANDIPEPDYAREFLQIYQIVAGEMGVGDRTRKAMETAGGMTKDYFLSTISKINKRLSKALSTLPDGERYQITALGERPHTRYAPNLEREQIDIRLCPG